MHYSTSSPTLDTPRDRAIEGLFGGEVPDRTAARGRCVHRLERSGGLLEQWQVSAGDGAWLQWSLGIQWPVGDAPCPVLLSPDGCWPHTVHEGAARVVNQEQVALAWFNRTELAFDPPDGQRAGPVFERWPAQGFGALSAWAWGLQRCVDVLLGMARTDAQRLAVIGHSRGGKAALLAGASDARICATIAHNSGTAGAASLQRSGPGAETLVQLVQRFPHWLGRHSDQASVQADMITMDATTCLMSALAPRGLCLLQAQDDAWANPEGTRHAFKRLQAHWPPAQSRRLVLHERTGGHAMGVQDWQVAARFARELR